MTRTESQGNPKGMPTAAEMMQRLDQTLPGGMHFAIRKLLRGCNRAALATNQLDGAGPYVSLVTVSTDYDGSPLLLLSKLADHTRNLLADPRISLLFDGTEGYANPQQGQRVTLVGAIEPCTDPAIRQRFLARHPGAALYADFPDFGFYRLPLRRAHWVGGFARALWVEDKLPAPTDGFAALEDKLTASVTGEQATALAQKLLKKRGKGWVLSSIDADGCDLTRSKIVVRLPFDSAAASAESAEIALKTRIQGIFP